MSGETRGEAPRRRGSRLVRLLTRWLSLYPPFLGAGIRVARRGGGESTYEVRMKLTRWNRNYVGTHFGGSLYSMCDPFYMLILMERLGPDYVVWDKAATIRFRRPGRGTVRARFDIPAERVEEIRAAADADGRTEPSFTAEIRDASGQLVAEVEKQLSVRRRNLDDPRRGLPLAGPVLPSPPS